MNQQNRLEVIKNDLKNRFEALNTRIQNNELVLRENMRFYEKYMVEKDNCNEEIIKLDNLIMNIRNAKMKKLCPKSYTNLY